MSRTLHRVCWGCGGKSPLRATVCVMCGKPAERPKIHSQDELTRRLSGPLPMMRDTIPSPPPTEPDNAIPVSDRALVLGLAEFTMAREEYERFAAAFSVLEIPRGEGEPSMLLPLIEDAPRTWERVVQLSNGRTGTLTVKVMDDVLIVAVELKEPGDGRRGRGLNTWATGSVDDDVRDVLADAREENTRIPDAFWELMSAPLKGD